MSYPPPAQSPLLPYTDRPTSPGTPGFAGRDASSPYLSESGSFAQTSMDGQSMLGLTNHVRQRSYQDDKEEEEGATALGGASGAKGPSEGGFWARIWSRGKRWIVLGVVLLMIIIVIAAAVPAAMNKSNNSKSEVALVADGKGSSSTSSSSQASSTRASSSTTLSSSTSSAAPTPTGRPSWGGDESTVYAEDGSTFTYNNTFGASAFPPNQRVLG